MGDLVPTSGTDFGTCLFSGGFEDCLENDTERSATHAAASQRNRPGFVNLRTGTALQWSRKAPRSPANSSYGERRNGNVSMKDLTQAPPLLAAADSES